MYFCIRIAYFRQLHPEYDAKMQYTHPFAPELVPGCASAAESGCASAAARAAGVDGCPGVSPFAPDRPHSRLSSCRWPSDSTCRVTCRMPL